jgi:hypothetical protein
MKEAYDGATHESRSGGVRPDGGGCLAGGKLDGEEGRGERYRKRLL